MQGKMQEGSIAGQLVTLGKARSAKRKRANLLERGKSMCRCGYDGERFVSARRWMGGCIFVLLIQELVEVDTRKSEEEREVPWWFSPFFYVSESLQNRLFSHMFFNTPVSIPHNMYTTYTVHCSTYLWHSFMFLFSPPIHVMASVTDVARGPQQQKEKKIYSISMSIFYLHASLC